MSDDLLQTLSRRILIARLAKGWTQRELADRAGLNKDTITGYEKARQMPRPGALLRVAGALGVEPSSLLTNGGTHGNPHHPDH